MALRRNQKIAFVLLFLILLFYYFHPAYVYAKSQAKDTMTSTTTLFINGTYAIPMPCMIQRSIEWIPLWYVSKALRIALGVRSEWHDGQWLFDTDYELSAADTEQRNPTSDLSVFIQGKRAYECKAEVATDPWGHKSTTFIKLVDMTRILEIMNIRLVKDGEFLSITKTVPVSIENVISEGSNGFLIITTPKFIYSDVVISHHFIGANIFRIVLQNIEIGAYLNHRDVSIKNRYVKQVVLNPEGNKLVVDVILQHPVRRAQGMTSGGFMLGYAFS